MPEQLEAQPALSLAPKASAHTEAAGLSFPPSGDLASSQQPDLQRIDFFCDLLPVLKDLYNPSVSLLDKLCSQERVSGFSNLAQQPLKPGFSTCFSKLQN